MFEERAHAFRVVRAGQGRLAQQGVRLVVVGRAVGDAADGFLDGALGDAGAGGEQGGELADAGVERGRVA